MKPNEQPRLLQQVVPADDRGSQGLAEVEQRAVPAEVKRLTVSIAFIVMLIAQVVAVTSAYLDCPLTALTAEAVFLNAFMVVHDFWCNGRFTGGNAKALPQGDPNHE